MMEVEYSCRDCGKRNETNIEENPEIVCESCGRNYGLSDRLIDQEAGVDTCGICGCRDLFLQKDFNRKIGCGIALIGAVLAPFTKLISLLVCASIDLFLYWILPFITVCYRCGSIYRDFPPNPSHEGFNLGINDHYRSKERSG